MGRKKRKKGVKPFCYYCDRGFDAEGTLVQHQKAKHFKCQTTGCNKKLGTAHALMNHMFKVHKETLSGVPNAKKGRDKVELNIVGMTGVPAQAIADRIAYQANNDPNKKAKAGEAPASPAAAPAAAPASPAAVAAPAPPSTPSQTYGMPMGGMGRGVPPQRGPPSQYGGVGMPPQGMHPGMRGMRPPQFNGMGRGYPPPGPYGRPPPGYGPPQGYGHPPGPPRGGGPPGGPPAGYGQAVGADFKPVAVAPPPSKKGGVRFVFKEDDSMEERRAALKKYKYNEDTVAAKLSGLDAKVQARLAELQGL